jgi:hypothetical protein
LALRDSLGIVTTMSQGVELTSQSADEARIVRALGKAPPRATVEIAVPPLPAPRTPPPEPPFYFVVKLEVGRPISRAELFATFTHEWLEACGEPVLFCGRPTGGGQVETLGRPGRPPPLGRAESIYDLLYLALSWEASKPARAPRTAQCFEQVLQLTARAAPQWSPLPLVAPKEAAMGAARLAHAKMLLGGTRGFVLDAPTGGFAGTDVWETLHTLGLSWGDMDAFWWKDSQARDHLFAVGTTTPPRYFVPEEIAHGKRYADLTFSISLGKHPESLQVLRAMTKFGGAIHERLGGTLRGRDGAPLDADALVESCAETLGQLHALGLSPGQTLGRLA